MINSDYVPVGCSVKVRGCDKIVFNVGCLIITPPIFLVKGGVSIPIVNSWNPIVSSSWNLSGYYTMPSGQGQNMSFLAILKVNGAN